MITNALLLIALGLICLVGVLVSVIFTILAFANKKSGKYTWLTGFLVCFIGLVFCIFIFVRKAVHKVENFATNLNEQMTGSLKNYSDSMSYSATTNLKSNEHIKILKSYHVDSTAVPDQFYYYPGFERYYRFPLRYPFSIHCNLFKDNGELFNEANVKRFDENDNGERSVAIDKISKIAIDKNYLLIDQKITSTRSPDFIHHYLLFSFETEKTEEVNSENELIKLAKQKGYTGSGKLITINEYSLLFN